MRWSVARHDGKSPSGRQALPRTSRPTSSTGRRVAAQSRLGALSRASAACPYRIEKGEQSGLQRNRSSIHRGYRSKGSRSNRGLGYEFSRVQRISLSSVGRRGSCLGCANPNVGMDQTPQLSWRRRIRGIQLDRRAPKRRYRDIGLATVATELNFRLETLEPDLAEAVERGATTVLRARFGPSLNRRRRSVRAGEQGRRNKPRRLARKARQSWRIPIGEFVIPRQLRGRCQTKFPGRLTVVASGHERPVPVFQQLARSDPSGRDDVREIPSVAAQCRGSPGPSAGSTSAMRRSGFGGTGLARCSLRYAQMTCR